MARQFVCIRRRGRPRRRVNNRSGGHVIRLLLSLCNSLLTHFSNVSRTLDVLWFTPMSLRIYQVIVTSGTLFSKRLIQRNPENTQESYSVAIQSTSYLRNVNAPFSFFSGGESEKLFTRRWPRGMDSFAFFFSPDSGPNLASASGGARERAGERTSS